MTSQLALGRSMQSGIPIALGQAPAGHAALGPKRPDSRALASGLLAMHPAWLLLDPQGRVCDVSRGARRVP